MKISVIIPTLNRSKRLKSVLKSIENQSHLENTEIIVIDNGSIDETKQVIYEFSSSRFELQYEFNNTPGLLTGRHRGTEIATGEILCFLDDDVELNPDYLKELSILFADLKIQLATGPCLPKYEILPPDWLDYLWSTTEQGKHCGWLSLIDFGHIAQEIHPNFVWGLNFCIRKKALIELGGFHPDSMPTHLQKFQGNGETGLTIKADQMGLKAIYDPKLALKHYVPKERLTIDYFKKRAFFQGVCESFTHLRESNNVNPIQKKKSIRDHLHPYYRWIKIFIRKKNTSTIRLERKPELIENIFNILDNAQEEGYKFHQNQFHLDGRVKDWVLKENYWDYRLPI